MARRNSPKASVRLRRLQSLWATTKDRTNRVRGRVVAFADKRPLPAFFSLLGIFLILIIAGNFLRSPKATPDTGKQQPVPVDVFSIGQSPKVELTAKVEKTGVITVSAQSGGIVQAVNVYPGQRINRGTNLVSLSTNYQGGSIPGATRQIAQANYKFVTDNFDLQKDMISKRRDIATRSAEQSDQLRQIADQSLGGTRELIRLNEEILASIDANIAFLESSGADEAAIMEAKSTKATVLGGLTSLRTAVHNAELGADPNRPPTQLAQLSKELTLKQLDLEEKSLELNREMSRLNLLVSQISESLLYPVTPVSGVIERVYISYGQNVKAGDPIATITGDEGTLRLVALVGSNLAKQISRISPSVIHIGSEAIELTPQYVSNEPTDGAMHAVTWILPETYASKLTNASYVSVEVSVAGPKTTAAVPFVPLDAVFQTQSGAYVFVASASADKKQTAASKSVTLGEVVGSYVYVSRGLTEGDQIIVNRNVIAGDPVEIK